MVAQGLRKLALMSLEVQKASFVSNLTPIPAPTLAQIVSICFSQVSLSSRLTPRHVYVPVLGTGILLIKIGLLEIFGLGRVNLKPIL